VTAEYIDSHAHLWDLDRRDQGWIGVDSPLRRNFGIDDLRAATAPTPISRVVLVQVINDEAETWDFLACSAREELIAGVVGWTDIAAPNVSDKLGELMATGHLVAIRHQLLAEPDPIAWLQRSDVHRGLAELARSNVVFDLLIRPEHFAAAIDVVRAHPSLQFVLNHIGKAPIAAGKLEPWATGLRQLAAEPNVACKLSGMMTIANMNSWTYDDIRPFAAVVVEAFGPSRLMFGSDWPVSTRAASYGEVFEVAQLICSQLGESERDNVLRGTARTIYRIK
jgi:L-fuconolactonase